MQLAAVDGDDPRAVLRALRAAMNGSGPALALGFDPEAVADAAASDAASGAGDIPAGTVAVIRTSGSTGVPKSVVLSRAALTASALATTERIGSGRWLLALPASYVAGLQVLVRSLVAGYEPAMLSGRFSADAFSAAALSFVAADGDMPIPAYTSLVPAQLATLVDAAESDERVARALRSFEAILVGGQALAQPLLVRAAELGARIVRTYGSSETAGGCVYDGVALAGVGIRVAESGEVCISGPTLASGYLGEPERTASAFEVQDGIRWYRTGDAGTVADGVLRISGRIDNVIVSGGINVSLDRVEALVRAQPGYADAVVVGAAHARWGEVPVVVTSGAVTSGGADLDSLRSVVGSALGAAARPDRVFEVDALPLLPSGKPDRQRVRKLVTPDR